MILNKLEADRDNYWIKNMAIEAKVVWSEGNYAFMVASENKHSYWLHDVIKVCRIERIGNKFDKKK